MSIRQSSFEPLENRQLLSGSQFPVTFGTTAGDTSTSVAADRAGNIYVSGSQNGVGTVSRYAPDGTLVWVRNFDGATPTKIATDGAGNVYFAGSLSGTVDFDPRRGVNNVTSRGGTDAFVARLSGKGNLGLIKTFGGKGDDVASGLAVDYDGNMRVGGTFVSRANFNPDGTLRISSSGGTDGFITALDSTGAFQWAGSFGGSGNETLSDMAVDGSGNILATGRYQGTVDFDPTTAGVNNNIAATDEAYTLKWTSTGGFVFSAGFGGPGVDYGTGVTADRAGNVYTIGNFESSGDFDPSGSTFTVNGAATGTVFVSKLNSAGTFVYAKAIGGASSVSVGPAQISVDKHQNVYTTGRFTGTQDFDPSGATSNLTSDGADDVFVSKLDANGAFLFAKSIGGAGDAFPTGSVLDHDGNILITGPFESDISFPKSGGGTASAVSTGSSDIFLTKLDSTGIMV